MKTVGQSILFRLRRVAIYSMTLCARTNLPLQFKILWNTLEVHRSKLKRQQLRFQIKNVVYYGVWLVLYGSYTVTQSNWNIDDETGERNKMKMLSVIVHRKGERTFADDCIAYNSPLNESRFDEIESFRIRYAKFPAQNFNRMCIFRHRMTIHSAVFGIVSIFFSHSDESATDRLYISLLIIKMYLLCPSRTYIGLQNETERKEHRKMRNSIVSKYEISVCAHDQRCHPWWTEHCIIVTNNHCV